MSAVESNWRCLNTFPDGSFFEIESPQYTIVKGPAWLKLDPAAGILSGKPDVAGKFEVSILATIEREQRRGWMKRL